MPGLMAHELPLSLKYVVRLVETRRNETALGRESAKMNDTYRNQLTAADIMQTEVVTVGPTTTVQAAAHRMVEHHVSGLPVVDAQGRCLGIVSTSDIMRFVDRAAGEPETHIGRFTKYFDDRTHRWEYLDLHTFFSDDLAATEVAEVMTRDPLHVQPWALLREVAAQMYEHEVHRILVLGEGHYLKGIISAMDFVRLEAATECAPAEAV
jgi:CBS domain-containing protein